MSNFQSGPVNLNDNGVPLRYEDAAIHAVVPGWVCVRCSRYHGNFPGSEHSARYCCHTDAKCPTCSGRKTRHQVGCDACYQKQKKERYAKLIQVASPEPSHEAPWCLMDSDTYFFEWEDFAEYCEEHDLKASAAMVVMCQPHNPTEFSISEYVVDVLGEDDEYRYSEEAIAAEKAVNSVLKAGCPWSWFADNTRRPSDADLARIDAQWAQELTEGDVS